ncbi:MAG: N-acetyltransferase [Planctomycetes bacterium]|nr:N-acetyltransferase [Planctomycetota bacterium]
MSERAPRIHPTAIVEPGAVLGPGTAVWDSVHVRSGACIGRDCIIGEKTYVAYDVHIGDLCKVNANVYLCAGVTLLDGVMVAAHTVFTNDLLPRATDPDLAALQTSAPTEATLATRVGRGATIGANCTIGPGVVLGDFCMVGMGSVVTTDVPPHALVLGNPARLHGVVCRCGEVVARAVAGAVPNGEHACRCGRRVAWPTVP